MIAAQQATVTWRDDSLPHQIRLIFVRDSVTQIGVSCTCRRTGGGSGAGDFYRPITVRPRWDDPAAPMAIWRAHMTGVTP